MNQFNHRQYPDFGLGGLLGNGRQERNALLAIICSTFLGTLIVGVAAYAFCVAPANGAETIEAARDRLSGFSAIVFGTTVVSVALAYLIGTCVARKMGRQIFDIQTTLDCVIEGERNVQTTPTGSGELSEISTAVNQLIPLVQYDNERDTITHTVNELAERIRKIADGDLKADIDIETDLTGPIADAMNHMLLQLRRIFSHVQIATIHVSSMSDEVHNSTQVLSNESESQVAEILAASCEIEDMARSIQEVARNTSESDQVATQARENANKGSDAVRNTIQGMERIRGQVRDTAHRIKRLGESSQQVGEIVQVISDIADRTSILAINASIQAATAGEAGQGFAVVAEEVERLAQRSNGAAKEIATLIKAIQSDTAEAIVAMEESTKEVVNGSELANEAGEALREIDSVSHRLATLIHSISGSTKTQADAAAGVSRSMSEICEVTKKTANGTKDAAMSISNLANLADSLRASVIKFKLPVEFDARRGRKPVATDTNGSSPAAPVAALPPVREMPVSQMPAPQMPAPQMPVPQMPGRENAARKSEPASVLTQVETPSVAGNPSSGVTVALDEKASDSSATMPIEDQTRS